MTFILLRKDQGQEDVAVRPVSQFPSTLEENPIDRYKKYKGLRQVVLRKGEMGLGIMIIEGKHQEAGTGVFISDLRAGSEADRAGLLLGDMILAVNNEDFVGASYETAAKVLRKSEGEIKVIVANPNLPDSSALPALAPETTAASTGSEKPRLPPKPSIAPKPANLLQGSGARTLEREQKAKEVKEKVDPTKVKIFENCLKIREPKMAGSKYLKLPLCSAGQVEIGPGQDTTIEILKDKDEEGKPMGLGLSIVGGSDTLLGAIFIHEVTNKCPSPHAIFYTTQKLYHFDKCLTFELQRV